MSPVRTDLEQPELTTWKTAGIVWVMQTVTVEHAATHFEELLEAVASGEEYLIRRDGLLVARLLSEPSVSAAPLAQSGPWPLLGRWEGCAPQPEGWDDPLPAEIWDVLRS